MPNKLPEYLDNPIDVCIFKVCEKLDNFFVKCHMTPNKLTTISGYFGLLAIYCLYNKIRYLPGIFFFISYMFDCADGRFARKHNMVTKFGDYYDHLKDWIIMGILFYLLYKRNKKYLYICIFALGISSVHIGCQEIYYSKNNTTSEHSETLSFSKSLCKFNDIDNAMKYTRYIGLGTSNLLISIILFYV